ncbi:MAG TPA: 1,4-dihydroxy-6-naphthoate synthase [Deltaproteobacteria bacterium]|nr:1,4-dihydroxy-6-naphthoate synthase [Deltaproteobacteria bacterium]
MKENGSLTFGFSPCPNDTYIFYALAHGKLDSPDLKFQVDLQDVETLNLRARDVFYDLTKISIHAICHVSRDYVLLNSGGAMGKGCGPLVISGNDIAPHKLRDIPVAIPGKYTTANLLFQIFTDGNPNVVAMPYDTIMEKVARGEIPAGVIIHEGRFTYHLYGLKKVIDLGEWWEEKYSLPLPLGGILMKRTLGNQLHSLAEALIRESLFYSRKHEKEVWQYVKEHAQEMSDDVIKQHIDLYVNEYSEHFGESGRKAIFTLLELGTGQGFLPEVTENIFWDQ